MFTYLKGQIHVIILGFITALIFSLVSLATPYITKFLIDIVFNDNRPDLLTPLLLVCGVVIIVMSLTGVISDWSQSSALIQQWGTARGLRLEQIGLRAGLLLGMVFPVLMLVGVTAMKKRAKQPVNQAGLEVSH